MLVLEANRESSKKHFAMYYTIYLIRFWAKVRVVSREPAETNIQEQINKYSSRTFNPDFIVVDLFSGKSRNVNKPFATYKFNYKNNG